MAYNKIKLNKKQLKIPTKNEQIISKIKSLNIWKENSWIKDNWNESIQNYYAKKIAKALICWYKYILISEIPDKF